MHERNAARVIQAMAQLPPQERERVASNEREFEQFVRGVLKDTATAVAVEIIKRLLGLRGIVRFRRW